MDGNDNFYLSDITFNTGGSTTLGVIGAPAVIGSVQSLSVTAATRIAPEQTFTQPTWITATVWTCRGVSAVCFVWAGALVLGGYASLGVADGLIVSAYNVISVGIRAYAAGATAVAAVANYINGVGCFRAGTPVLASGGLQPIETIQLGRRVITTKGESSGPSLDPEKTRLIRLSFVKDGQQFLMSFLRPAKTVEGLSAGDTMNIAVMELAVSGRAWVLAVEPCPPIEDGPGSVVTGAFHSETVDLYKLKLEGLDEPMEVTGNHPIFSQDRVDFVPANSLSEGEQLRTRDGMAIVESIERKYGQWTVYNLEVESAHRYYVTERQVLVHNDNGIFKEMKDLEARIASQQETIDMIREALGDAEPNELFQRMLGAQTAALAALEGRLAFLRTVISN